MITRLLALSLGVLGFGFAAASETSNSDPLKLRLQYEDAQQPTWIEPSVFTAQRRPVGASFGLTQFYGDWHGRRIEMKEELLGIAPIERAYLWYAKQQYVLKGRTGSRAYLDADTFGGRVLVKDPDETGAGGIALQLEFIKPGSANIFSGSSAAIYPGTRDWSFGLIGSQSQFDYQVQYTNVKVNTGSDHADVLNVGLGRNFGEGSRFVARAQAELVGQRVRTPFDRSTSIKPVLYLAAQFQVAQGLNLVADVTAMPSGVPYAYGRLTPLTSLFVYNPGQPVDRLKSEAFAIGSLRLEYNWKF